MARLALRHLDKRFPGGVHAVRDVSLEVADGELVVLVGPSGCGKTTTLRLIAGLETASAGDVYFDGQPVGKLPPCDRDVAMVSENAALYPHLSVYQNLAFGLRIRGTARAEIDRRVRDAAATLQIESLLDRRPSDLSAGQRQRVALGRAIVRRPKLFLLDEPLAHLDPALRVELRTEFARLQQQLHATVLYVTHDHTEAMTLGECVVVIHGGAIQQVDTPLGLYRRPANKFVGSFLGSPPMNFFQGYVGGGEFHLEFGGSVRLQGSVPDGPATLGVRPEDVIASSNNGTPLAHVTLERVEQLGHETLAHFALEGKRHVARLPADAAARTGSQLTLSIRPGAEHVFAGDESGRRLN